MSNTKQQQQQRRAILDVAITPPTHRTITIKAPIEVADGLKAKAREKGMIFSRYALEILEKGGLP